MKTFLPFQGGLSVFQVCSALQAVSTENSKNTVVYTHNLKEFYFTFKSSICNELTDINFPLN